jgi:hypothetical protein
MPGSALSRPTRRWRQCGRRHHGRPRDADPTPIVHSTHSILLRSVLTFPESKSVATQLLVGTVQRLDTLGRRWAITSTRIAPAPPTGSTPPRVWRSRKDRALPPFAGLPRHYDRAGAALSCGQDPRRRAALVAAVGARPSQRILDVATGTGPVADRARAPLGRERPLGSKGRQAVESFWVTGAARMPSGLFVEHGPRLRLRLRSWCCDCLAKQVELAAEAWRVREPCVGGEQHDAQ